MKNNEDVNLIEEKKNDAGIEQFYKKPENQKELVDNIKILRDISEDINEVKVVIKLGARDKKHKFVFMEDEDTKKYLICLPIEKKDLHVQIEWLARKLFNKELKTTGGGYLHTEGNDLIIDGTSREYGEAPKILMKEILQKKFPDVKVISNPAE